MRYVEFFKFLEKKDHIIKKLPLTDEQKQLAIEFFGKYPSYESEIDWNRKDLTWEDFEKVIYKSRNTKSQIKKAVRQGIEGITEGVDYNYIGEGVYKDKPFYVYIPANWKGSRVLASDQVEPKLGTVYDGFTGAKWCISYQKTDQYWNSYTRTQYIDSNTTTNRLLNSASIFLFFFGESIPSYKLALQLSLTDVYKYLIESKGKNVLSDNTRVFNIWTSKDRQVTDTKKYYKFFEDICVPFIETHKSKIKNSAFFQEKFPFIESLAKERADVEKGTEEATEILIDAALKHYCEPNSKVFVSDFINKYVEIQHSLVNLLYNEAIELPEIVKMNHREHYKPYRSSLHFIYDYLLDNYEITSEYYDISEIILAKREYSLYNTLLKRLFKKKGLGYDLVYNFKHFKGDFTLNVFLDKIHRVTGVRVNLNSLQGCPEECHSFVLKGNYIISENLVGGPKRVMNYTVEGCGLRSIEGAPTAVGYLNLSYNSIESVENLYIDNTDYIEKRAMIDLKGNRINNLNIQELDSIGVIDITRNPIKEVSEKILDRQYTRQLTLWGLES